MKWNKKEKRNHRQKAWPCSSNKIKKTQILSVLLLLLYFPNSSRKYSTNPNLKTNPMLQSFTGSRPHKCLISLAMPPLLYDRLTGFYNLLLPAKLSNASALSRLSNLLLPNASALSRLTTRQQRPILPAKLSNVFGLSIFRLNSMMIPDFNERLSVLNFQIRSSSRHPGRWDY